MLTITIIVAGIIIYLCRKPLARAARELAKRAARALWKRLMVKLFGHCRTCAAPAVPLHTCVVKASRRTAVKPGTAAGIMAARDTKAVRNGWLPPKEKLTPVLVSRECAGGECAICPGGKCGCSCNHDAKLIVARNEARYDAEHAATDKVPF